MMKCLYYICHRYLLLMIHITAQTNPATFSLLAFAEANLRPLKKLLFRKEESVQELLRWSVKLHQPLTKKLTTISQFLSARRVHRDILSFCGDRKSKHEPGSSAR